MLSRLQRIRNRMQVVGIGRVLFGAAVRRGVDPARARTGIRYVKTALRFGAVMERRRPRTRAIPPEAGYLRIDHPAGVDDLLAHCRALWAKRKDNLLANFSPPYAQVITTTETPEGIVCTDPSDYEPILRFLEQPAILDPIVGYMGEVPVVSNVALVYTVQNDTVVGPQQFHRDMNHPNQIHVVVLIEEVDEGAGPLTFLPAAESDALNARIQHEGGRLTDEVFDGMNLQRCVGPAGTVYLLNPYACFHCGARARTRSRYILIANMTSIAESGEGLAALYRARDRKILDNGSPTRRLLLDL